MINIFGILFGMFIPGYLITLIFFREVKIIERMLLSITFSIAITIAISIGLGYNENVKNITGGIAPTTVWIWELLITAILFLIAVIVNRKEIPDMINKIIKRP